MINYDNFIDLDFGKMRDDDSRFGKGKRINRLKINTGETKVIRFLRAATDPKFYIVRKQHWGIPVGVGKTPPLACTKAHNSDNCYFCTMVNEYYNSGDPRKQSLARRMKATSSVTSNVIDIKDPLEDDGSPKVQIWQYSWKVYQDIMGYFRSPDYGDLTHPVSGRNFKVSCEVVSSQGDRQWTKYIIQVGANPTELEVPDALGHLYDLGNTFPLKFYSPDEQEAIFDGTLDPRTGSSTPTLGGNGEAKQIEEASTDSKEEFETQDSNEDWDDLVEDTPKEDGNTSVILDKLEELKRAAREEA